MKRAALLGLFLSVLLSRMFLINPVTDLYGDFGDKYEFFSFQQIIAEKLRSFEYPFVHSDVMRYPVGFEFGHGYDGAFAAVTGALFSFIIPPILSYNITILLILTINFLCVYILFRYISTNRSSLIVFIASAIFAFSPYVFARINAGHMNLALIGGFPLVVYGVLKAWKKIQEGTDRVAIGDFLVIGLGIFLLAAGSLQYLIIAAELFILGALLVAIVFFRDLRTYFMMFIRTLLPVFNNRRFVISIVAAAILTVAALLTVYGGYAVGMARGTFVYGFDYQEFVDCCIPQPSDLFIPNIYLGKMWGYLNKSLYSVERVVTMGVVEWLLAGWLVAKEQNRRLRILMILCVVAYAVLTLNWINMPYWPEGGRSIVVVTLAFLAIGLMRNYSWNRYAGGIVVTLLVLERVLMTMHATPPLPTELGDLVASQPGKAVLNIPISKYLPSRSVLPYVYQKNIVDGYFHDTAENEQATSFIKREFIDRYICDEEKAEPDELSYGRTDLEKSLQLWRSLDIRTIVVHKDPRYEKFLYESCRNVRYWWYNLSPEKIIVSEDTGGDTAQTLELAQYPNLKADVFFARGGVFQLNGAYITPSDPSDTAVELPDHTVLRYVWEPEGKGVRTPPDGNPVVLYVSPGDMITFSSDKPIDVSAYLTVFYRFTPDNPTSVLRTPPIQKRFSTNTIDVYTVE